MPSAESPTKRQKLKKLIREIGSRFPRGIMFKAIISRLQSSTFIQFMKAIEPLALVLAVVVFVIEIQGREEDRASRAWQTIATTQSAPSGTVSALEYLNQQTLPDYLTWLPFAKRRVDLSGVELLAPPLSKKWTYEPKDSRELPYKCPGYYFLRRAQLPGAILRDSTLTCADLRHADLRNADLARVDFRRALLWKVDFRGATLGSARFEYADLWEADFRKANFNNPPRFRVMRPPVEFGSKTGLAQICDRDVVTWNDEMGNQQNEPASSGPLGSKVSFQHADLRRVDMRGVVGAFTDFQEADIRGADLRTADLKHSDFRGANLFAAKLRGTNLARANLKEVVGVTCNQLREAKSWEQSVRDLVLECGSPINDGNTDSAKEESDIFELLGNVHCP